MLLVTMLCWMRQCCVVVDAKVHRLTWWCFRTRRTWGSMAKASVQILQFRQAPAAKPAHRPVPQRKTHLLKRCVIAKASFFPDSVTFSLMAWHMSLYLCDDGEIKAWHWSRAGINQVTRSSKLTFPCMRSVWLLDFSVHMVYWLSILLCALAVITLLAVYVVCSAPQCGMRVVDGAGQQQ